MEKKNKKWDVMLHWVQGTIVDLVMFVFVEGSVWTNKHFPLAVEHCVGVYCELQAGTLRVGNVERVSDRDLTR